jgi:hypothetical protein
MILPGGGGRDVVAAAEDSDGWRTCPEPVGEFGRADGGWGCERNARCSCRVGARRVVASPERFSDGKSRREYKR